jgi:SAM-dependent methyltransferase
LSGNLIMPFDAAAYKKAVAREWENAAKGWHKWIPQINEWLETATRTMLDQAGVKNGSRVIDIAAGDGGQSVMAAHRVGATGEVLATDIAPEFVRIANVVATDLGMTQLRAEVMDAENLTLPKEHYDAAISRLGLMYLPDLAKGLLEIKRVLRPGGRFCAVVFTTAEKTPFFSIPVKMIRQKRGLPSPEPGQPGPFALGEPGIFSSHLKAAGFTRVREQVIEAPLRFASARQCVDWRRQASGTMAQMLNGLDQLEQQSMWDEIIEAMRKFETPQGFQSPCELLICSGVK